MINSSVHTNAHVISAFSISFWGVSSCDPSVPTETQQLVADDSFFDLLPKLFSSSQGGLEAFSNGSTHTCSGARVLPCWHSWTSPGGWIYLFAMSMLCRGLLEIGDVAENLK